jgi:ectoine hydroxylase-related dioxygenase (phytanoyl-CoA dioxygenase family)
VNEDPDALAATGYVLLRSAIPGPLIAQALAAFAAGYLPSAAWPVPRGADWRHAQVDLDPAVLAICNLPAVLDCAARIIAAPHFLAQVEGRDPLRGNPAQPLHRDMELSDPRCAVAIAYLDDYGPDNGATRLVPGSHQTAPDAPGEALCLAGAAGDVLIMDAALLHGATTNHAGLPRRALLATFANAELHVAMAETAPLRGVRMEPGLILTPAG